MSSFAKQSIFVYNSCPFTLLQAAIHKIKLKISIPKIINTSNAGGAVAKSPLLRIKQNVSLYKTITNPIPKTTNKGIALSIIGT